MSIWHVIAQCGKRLIELGRMRWEGVSILVLAEVQHYL